jgi:hypothetical protein
MSSLIVTIALFAAYRVGDSPMNAITPLNAHFAMIVPFVAAALLRNCSRRKSSFGPMPPGVALAPGAGW